MQPLHGKRDLDGQPAEAGDRKHAVDPLPGNRPSVAHWLIASRWVLAGLGAIILAVAWPLSGRLEMDRTIEQMFPADDPTLLAYHELQQAFGGNAVVMLVYRDPELFTPEGLKRAGQVSAQVEKIEGVRGVLSVAQLNEVLGLIRPAGLLTGLRGDTPPLLRQQDLVARAFNRLFAGYTHSEDEHLASIVALLEEADEGRGHAAVIDQLERVTEQMPAATSGAVLVGEPVLLERGFDLIERDGDRLAWLTIALLSPCVLVLLRSLRYVVLQVIVILWATSVTRAGLYLLDVELSLVSSILTAIVTVIAVTAVIHLGSRQRALRNRGYSGLAAALAALTWVMPPVFWACMTDAAGFISLWVSEVVPIREFGWMMAIASIAVWVAIALFAPLVMTVGSESLGRGHRFTEPKLLAALERWIRRLCLLAAIALLRYRPVTLVVTGLLAGLTLAGITRLEIESSFLRNFRADSPLVQAYQMVESELSGAGVWDVILDAPDDLTSEYMTQVRELEKQLRELDVDGEKLTKVISLADADRIVTAIPLMRIATPEIRLSGMRTAIPAFSDALLVPRQVNNENQAESTDGRQPSATSSPQRRKLRIMLRAREHIPAETKMVLIGEVERVVAEHTQSAAWQDAFTDAGSTTPGRVTGYYVMLARIVSQLIRDQWRCLVVSGLLVWLLLIAATRSLRLATIALIPNLLPVMGVLAILGLSDVRMNMGAAMIAAVSIGLSIDGSVHFLSGFQRKLARQRSPYHAVLFAQKQIGLPLLMATLALTIGFSVLATSDFIPTATFGVLTAAALVAGTVANLTLLPALLGGRGRPRSSQAPASP